MSEVRQLPTALASLFLFSAPVHAQSTWKDISPEVAKILGIPSLLNPWYLREGSRRTVKSVEFPGTIYESAEFSYTKGNETTRRKFFIDCRTASYKDTLATKGHLSQMTYIPFNGESLYNGGEFDGWIAYKYLCPKAKNPWLVIAESSDGDKYAINAATAVRLQSSPYKHSYFYISSKIQQISSPEIMGLYVACKPKRAMFRAIYDIINYFPRSKELNPDSIGEEITSVICGAFGHK